MLDRQGSFLIQDFTQSRAKFYGAEAEAIISLLPDTLNLRLFTDIVYGQLQHNENIPRLTPQRFGLDLDYRWRNWSANFNLTRVTQQNRVGALETRTPGYVLMNAEAGYHMKYSNTFSFTLFLQGRNLLDQDIRVHTSFLKDTAPLPGRAIVAGIRGAF